MIQLSRPLLAVAAGAAILSNCGRLTPGAGFLGSAVIEAKTYQIAATVSGQVVATFKEEGAPVAIKELLAIIDTVPLCLKRRELDAGAAQIQAQIASKKAEIASAHAEVSGTKRERDRISRLAEKGSAPQQQADELRTRFDAGSLRVDAANLLLKSLAAQLENIAAQQALLNDQIFRSFIRSPVAGIVLTQYKNAGEVAAVGQPVYEVGAYDTVYADFFAPQPAVAALTAGQTVSIRVDLQDSVGKRSARFVPATITWISQDAEFSPKNIQTRENRCDLVFRVRAAAANPHRLLKRGLPVEIWRATGEAVEP